MKTRNFLLGILSINLLIAATPSIASVKPQGKLESIFLEGRLVNNLSGIALQRTQYTPISPGRDTKAPPSFLYTFGTTKSVHFNNGQPAVQHYRYVATIIPNTYCDVKIQQNPDGTISPTTTPSGQIKQCIVIPSQLNGANMYILNIR